MTRPCLPPDPDTRAPRHAPPPRACDSHVHVFPDHARFPLSANRSFTPPEAPVENLLQMLDRLGVERGVVVHSSAYGTDTRASEAAVLAAPDRLRGVAVTDAATTQDHLRRLDRAGFCGTRLSTVVKGTASFDQLEAIAANVRPLDWHVAVHVGQSHELAALAPRLLAIGNTVVIDHIARVRADEGTASAGYQALLRLLDSGRCWVKVSALHRTSSQPFPWSDMQPLIDGIVAARPDRIVWGTDWPHVNQYDDMQNDADHLDAFARWIPDEQLRHRILVDNPAALYRF